MRILIALLVVFQFSGIDAQNYYFNTYPNHMGLIFNDIDIRGDTLVAVAGYIFEDPIAKGNNQLSFIDANTGEEINSIWMDYADNEISAKLHLLDSSSSAYIYFWDLQNQFDEDDRIMVAHYDYVSDSLLSVNSIPFSGRLMTNSWLVEKDSILLMNTNHHGRITSYTRLNKGDLNSGDSTRTAPDMGISLRVIPVLGTEREYMVYSMGKLFHWKEKEQVATQVELNDSIFGFGDMTRRIDLNGYAIFGRGYKESFGNGGARMSLVTLDSSFNFVNVGMFGTGSWDYNAIYRSIDSDDSHYFVSAHKEMTLFPYSSTTPQAFYVGKFDEDLNEEWVHILGGDQHYFLAGIKADGMGGCYVYGFTRPEEYNFQAIPFLMRLDSNGLISSIDDREPDRYHLTIYGNPGRENFRFGLRAGETGYRMQLVDLSGRTLSDIPVIEGAQEISMSSYPAGTYLWQLYHPSGKILETGKWVKAD